MKNGRIENTLRIMVSKNIKQIVELITSFVTRTFFIHCLGADYLGLNGLFSSILSALSLADLGVGSAIVFHLYKPIAVGDEEEIKKLVRFYKTCYLIIGTFIFIVGCCLIPTLPYIVNFDTNVDLNLYIIYILYLFNTASSYWFYSYLQSVANAYQKQDIVNKYVSLFKIVTSLICSAGLIISRNYYVYLVAQIIVTFAQNICIRKKLFEIFPVIRKLKGYKLEHCKVMRIFKDVSAIMVDRVSNTLSTSFDSLIVSAFVSTTMVGYISNYMLINGMVIGVATSIATAAYASIGDLVSTSDTERQIKVFKKLDFANHYLLYFVCVCETVLATPFIILWSGDSYTVSFPVIFCIYFDAYIYNLLWPIWGFKDGMGLFNKGKFLKLIRGVINIVMSIAVCRKYGAFGVYFASLITNLLITVPNFTYIVFRYGFNKSPREQLVKVLFRMCLTVSVIFITRYLCGLLGTVSIVSFIGMMAICSVVPNLIFFLLYHKTSEWKELQNKYFIPILNRVKHINSSK